MSVGTAFYPRTAPLNTKLQWREWSGYLAASAYADSHEIEYNAIREAAALIDVSPLYKYLVSGPDATRLVDRVITRDASKLAVGRVYYTSWCNEDGRVVDDGTVGRLDEQTYRWTAADSSLRWLRMNARGLDVEIEDVSERISALAVQGPLSRDVLEAATETSWGDLKYFGRRAGAGRQHPRRRLPDGVYGRPRLRGVGRERSGGRALGRPRAGRKRLRHPAGRDARPRHRADRGRADPHRSGFRLGAARADSRAVVLALRAGRPGPLRRLRETGGVRRPSRARAGTGSRRACAEARRARARLGAARGAVPREGADADAGAGRLARPRSCVRAGPPDRQSDQHDVEPDTEEGGCAGVSRCRPKQRSA